jgi:ABC-type transport system substrate-binding protein
MRRQTLLGCGLALVVMLLILPGSAPAQTSPPTPTPAPRQVDRLKVAVQLEREQNDPILMTVIYAAQYAPVYEALAEEDPWHNFVPMLATDWSMSPDGNRRGRQARRAGVRLVAGEVLEGANPWASVDRRHCAL